MEVSMVDTEAATIPQAPAVPNLKGMLKGIPGAPSDTDIEKWKQQFGEVHIFGFSETELFIWHPISRAAYVGLQKEAQAQSVEFDFEKAVIDACLLWTSDDTVFEKKGGSIPTLSEQIMLGSNFLNPAMANMLVMKL
jgi:hypothetical protein